MCWFVGLHLCIQQAESNLGWHALSFDYIHLFKLSIDAKSLLLFVFGKKVAL
jgi:hypothetical protein